MEDGWDLDAVVRSCAPSTTNVFDTIVESNDDRMVMRRNESELGTYNMNNMSGGLVEVKNDGCGQVQPTAVAAATRTASGVTSISFGGGGVVDEQAYVFGDSISFSMNSVDYDQHIDAKKRKNKKKKVVELREEELNNDGWAWRKYGQKPIKGSPNPRNYYRCSTTKDCLARKQVERSHANTSNFIVSYYGDHLHPRPTHLSSLSGTTRSTRFGMAITVVPEQPSVSSSSPPSTSSFSPTTSFKEDEIYER